jgi:hypothetical protein
MQGSLFAVSALANALGPISLQLVYNHTKNRKGIWGTGTMWVFASFLYGVGTVIVCFIPEDKVNKSTSIVTDESENDLEERLLGLE